MQAKGGPVREIKAGDTVWIPPNEKHWHGAGPNTGMVHIAMQEALDGKHVEWMELVTDDGINSASCRRLRRCATSSITGRPSRGAASSSASRWKRPAPTMSTSARKRGDGAIAKLIERKGEKHPPFAPPFLKAGKPSSRRPRTSCI